MRRLFLNLVVLAGLFGVFTGVALAHANLLRSQPVENAILAASPPEVRLEFTEPVDPGFSEIIVYNRNRSAVTEAKAQVDPNNPAVLSVPLPELGQGTYTVAWKVLSTVDGHTTQGAYAFGVGVEELDDTLAIAGGTRTTLPGPAAVFFKWLTLLGLATLVGGLIFGLWIAGPVARRQPPVVAEALAGGWLARWRRVALIAGVAVFAGLLGTTVNRGVEASGGGLGGALGFLTSPVFWSSRQGPLAAAGLLLALLVATLAVGLARGAGDGRPAVGDRRWILVSLPAAALLLVLSLNSHQAADSAFTVLAVAADWLHLVATCAWLGGLFHLLVTWRPAAAALKNDGDAARSLAALMPRFSTVGLLSVTTLLVTGSFNGWLQVGTLAGLTGTPYGRALLLKIAFFVPMVVLGAVNILWVTPRIVGIEANGRRLDRALSYGRHFRRFIAIEAAFGVLVLGAVGVLTNTSPAYQAALTPEPIVAETRAGDLRLILNVAPGQVGPNVFSLTILDANGQPVTTAERVRLSFEMTVMDMGNLELELTPRGEGQYAARGSELSMGGPWKIHTTFRRTDGPDVEAVFDVDVRALPVNPVLEPPGPSPWPVGWAIGPALLIAGLMLAFNARRLAVAGRRLATGAALTGFLTFIGGAYFLATAVQAGTTGLPQNPIPPNAASVARGAALYQQNCAICHGPEGRGNGPAARGLNPPPVDLTVHGNQHPPGQMFLWISQGIRGTAMPPFEDTLSEEDRWHLVNYVRSLAEGGAPLPR